MSYTDYTLIIFDLNGTLTNTPFIDKQPLALLPGVQECCLRLREAGVTLAIATNQGGVAFGFTTEEAVEAEMREIAEQIHASHYYVAYGHPVPKHGFEQYASPKYLMFRKPAPGMLLALMERAGVAPQETLMVGDRQEDSDAAKAAGVDFVHADVFFERGGEEA